MQLNGSWSHPDLIAVRLTRAMRNTRKVLRQRVLNMAQKDVMILSLFVFLLMFAVGMASPIVPLYAAELGASWIQIGLLGTSWGTTMILLAAISGTISDRVGRRPLLITAAALSSLAGLMYWLSSTVLQIMLVRILEAVAWALFWPSIEALATEIVAPSESGKSIGITTASYGVGFACGSLASGTIVGAFGYSQLFLSYSIMALASGVLAALFVHEGESRSAIRTSCGINWRRLLSRKTLPGYFLGATYTFGLGVVLTFYSVFSESLGIPVFWIGVVFGVFWLGRIVGSYGGGELSDIYGRKKLALLSMAGCGIGFTLVTISTGSLMLYVAALTIGLSIGAAFPVGVTLVSDAVGSRFRGYAMGVFESCCAVGFMVAATLGGALAAAYSARMPYLLASACSFFAAAALVVSPIGNTKTVH